LMLRLLRFLLRLEERRAWDFLGGRSMFLDFTYLD